MIITEDGEFFWVKKHNSFDDVYTGSVFLLKFGIWWDNGLCLVSKAWVITDVYI